MPDRTDSGQGRDALDAALDAYDEARDYLRRLDPCGLQGHIRWAERQVEEAHAAVRRLAEQGEEGQEMIVSADVGGYPAILLEKWHNLKPGARVRVTRIEEAP